MKHLLMVVNDYEGAQHREQRDNKERAWMKKMALDADLPFSDDDNNQDDNDDDDDDDWDNVNQRAISSSSSSSKRSKQLSEIKDLIATPLPTLQTR